MTLPIDPRIRAERRLLRLATTIACEIIARDAPKTVADVGAQMRRA